MTTIPGRRQGERVAYFNGAIVPESEVRIPFRDRGFKYGDAVFDMTRTFGHRIFKLEEHIARFYNSLKYVHIDPGMSQEEMIRHTEEVLAANLSLLGPDDDFWVGQRVSRGVDLVGGRRHERADPTRIRGSITPYSRSATRFASTNAAEKITVVARITS